MDGIFNVLNSVFLYCDLKLNILGYTVEEIDVSIHNHETDSLTEKKKVTTLRKSKKLVFNSE